MIRMLSQFAVHFVDSPSPRPGETSTAMRRIVDVTSIAKNLLDISTPHSGLEARLGAVLRVLAETPTTVILFHGPLGFHSSTDDQSSASVSVSGCSM